MWSNRLRSVFKTSENIRSGSDNLLSSSSQHNLKGSFNTERAYSRGRDGLQERKLTSSRHTNIRSMLDEELMNETERVITDASPNKRSRSRHLTSLSSKDKLKAVKEAYK